METQKFVKKIATFLLFIFYLTGLAFAKETPEMWGDLKAGSFDVGFRTIFAYDLSRPSVPYSDWDGRLSPTKETKGRQMQINVWYPAEITEKDSKFNFRHYLDLNARQTDFGAVDEQRRTFFDEQFVTKTNALGGGGTFTLEKLKVLEKLKTNAYLDAKAVNKKFPLIVFPNGGSPAFQSIMCEYFASHGFVVVGVALKGRHSSVDEVSLKGFETAIIDLNFAVGEVLEIPQVDYEKICMIGNANSSSHIVAYQTRNPNVDCIVSLEGGLLSRFEQRILSQTPFYDEQAVNKPILAIYAPHPSIDPENIYHLKYSDRYFFHFPQMTEFHFLNYGAFEKFVPNIIGKPKGNVQKGFELGTLYCLKFFEAFLKNDGNSLKFMKEKPSESVAKHIDKAFVKEALPTPPNLTVVKNAFMKEGFKYIERIYKEHKKQTPTPFSKNFYNSLKDWLAWKKDPKYENRYKLYQLALDSYPDSATVNYYIAYYALKTDKKDIFKKHYQKTLELLETDNSPELTVERKAQMKEFILKSLEDLNEKDSSSQK